MKKEYQRPEVEVVTLVTEENITTDMNDPVIGGSTGVDDSIFG